MSTMAAAAADLFRDIDMGGWFPISESNWNLLMSVWVFFPLVTAIQWLTPFYPQGKTSIQSRLNLPGRLGWAVMETPGFVVVAGTWILRHGVASLFFLQESSSAASISGSRLGSPAWPRVVMVHLFVLHYIYRAYVGPLMLNPSMSPIHGLIFVSAFVFQVCNGLAIGGWIAGFGPDVKLRTTSAMTTGLDSPDGPVRLGLVVAGLALWIAGWVGNIYHEEVLRNIRRNRPAPPSLTKDASSTSSPSPSPTTTTTTTCAKYYTVPPSRGLFRYMLYPHYLCEWIEWTGFWLIGVGLTSSSLSSPSSSSVYPQLTALQALPCLPALVFLVNEVATMTPRARQGVEWYRRKFGREAVDVDGRPRGAISPWW